MNCSFTPQGDWFVFDETGRTLKRGLKSKGLAIAWMAGQARSETN